MPVMWMITAFTYSDCWTFVARVSLVNMLMELLRLKKAPYFQVSAGSYVCADFCNHQFLEMGLKNFKPHVPRVLLPIQMNVWGSFDCPVHVCKSRCANEYCDEWAIVFPSSRSKYVKDLSEACKIYNRILSSLNVNGIMLIIYDMILITSLTSKLL